MPPTPAVLLCALSPLPDVRRHLLSRCPAGLAVREAATTGELRALPPTGTLVVLFDPARTSPADVRSACPSAAELVAVSDLRLPAAEVGVDATLPLRRLTEADVTRAVFDATERRALAAAR